MTAELYEVMVDAYGFAGELMRGDVIGAADVAYPIADLEARSIVRRLRPEEAARVVETGATSTTARTEPATEIRAGRDAARARARQIAAELAGLRAQLFGDDGTEPA